MSHVLAATPASATSAPSRILLLVLAFAVALPTVQAAVFVEDFEVAGEDWYSFTYDEGQSFNPASDGCQQNEEIFTSGGGTMSLVHNTGQAGCRWHTRLNAGPTKVSAIEIDWVGSGTTSSRFKGMEVRSEADAVLARANLDQSRLCLTLTIVTTCPSGSTLVSSVGSNYNFHVRFEFDWAADVVTLRELNSGTAKSIAIPGNPLGVLDFNFNENSARTSARTTTWDDYLVTTPLPTAPQNLEVAVAENPTGLTLTWGAPADPGSTPITKHRVYRGTSPESQTFLADVMTGLSYTDAGVGHSQTRYYRVTAFNDAGEGGSSSVVAGTTLTPNRMELSDEPDCDPVFSMSESYCNTMQYGYTNAIDESDPDSPEFTLDWGDFNGHEHVGCTPAPCNFWLEFDLSADSPAPSYAAHHGNTVPIAHLERLDGSTWEPLDNGLLSAAINAPPGEPWSLYMPHNLTLTSDELGTSQGSATFRLVAAARPEGGLWDLDLDAAMGQLVAPPVMLVHGWNPKPWKTADQYFEDAGWGSGMTDRLTARADFVYGQNPWNWSDGGAIFNVRYDGKADFRTSAFILHDAILTIREDPTTVIGDDLTYNGPVNLITHSMGGLSSRYLLEAALPSLAALDGGTIDPGNSRPLTAIEAELNEHNEAAPTQADQLVSSLVTMGTPNLGSGWAEKYIAEVNGFSALGSCILEGQEGDGCFLPYYTARDGSYLIEFNPRPTPQAWWTDAVGAYRNPAHVSRTTVMADFELTRLQDGNRVLRNLDRTFEPSGVDYLALAGVDGSGGDSIVSARSATRGFDTRACYKLFEQGKYFPWAMELTHDHALVFMAGEKTSFCQSPPGQQGSMMQSMAALESVGVESLESETESFYEPPIALTASDDGVYSMRLDWNAPGSSNGHLSLLAINGTLPEAAVTLRSPSGEIATLSGGNTSWASWSGRIESGLDHALRVGMPNAMQGAWTLWVNRTTLWPGLLFASLGFETSLGIETATDDHGVIREPVTFRIQPTNLGAPVLDATVTLDYYDPSSNGTQTMTLLDDGLNGDEAAGDGIYSGRHTYQANGSFPYTATATFAGTELSLDGATPILDEEEAPPAWPPSKPLNVTATRGPGGGEITLTWQQPTSDGGSSVTGYDVYRANETGVQTFHAATGNVLTFTDADLGTDATHTYTVAARNAIGYSRLSNPATATTFDLASAPRNLTATPGQAGEVVLEWEAPVDDGGSPVTNYTVYAGDEPGSEVALATVGNVLAYTETGLDDNVTRQYKVAAVTLAGIGALSETADATTITVAPSAPRNLTVAAGSGAGELTLAWRAPVDDGGDAIDGYAVYRGNGTAWSLLASLGPVLGYVDSGLGNDATWHYRVAAVNAAGDGPASTATNATTFDVPTAPQNITATVGPSAGEITLTWQPPINDGGTPVTNYTVYAGNATGDLAELAVLGALTYTESGLPDDATRYYAVSATNLAGEGPQSNETAAGTFDVPTPPLDLEAVPGIGNVTLTWQAPESNGGTPVTGYRVYRGNASGDLDLYASIGDALTYVDGDATPGTRYYYAVSSINIAGEGPASSEASARPSALLLSLPAIALPDDEEPVVTITVCDSSSDSGCTGSLVVESPDSELGDGFGIDPANPDPDGDHYVTQVEATGGSNPFQQSSTPLTDDDGDGKLNKDEYNQQGIGIGACSGAFGVVVSPGCGGYKNPSGYPGAGLPTPWQDSNEMNWVWDGVCMPAAGGNYTTCKATGNRGLSTAEYHGNWTGDGYGWRRLDTSPSLTAQTYGLCPDGIQDPDLDGIPTFHLCSSALTVDSNGEVEQGEPHPWQTVGDPEPARGAFLCIELKVATAPAVKLACIDHAFLPPEVDAALHELMPIEIRAPVGAVASTPEIQMTYLHEAALLNPVLVACAPLHPMVDDAT